MTDSSDIGARVRDEASARRSRGEYPEGLEEHLDRHYRVIAQQGRGERAARLREQAGRLRAIGNVEVPEVPADSRVPGGRLFHRLVASSVRRQIEPLVGQLNEFRDAVGQVLEVEAEALADLRGHVDAVSERFAVHDGLPDDLRAALTDIAARVRSLEAGLRGDLPPE